MFTLSFHLPTSTTTSFTHLSHLISVTLLLTHTTHPANPPLFLVLLSLTPNTNTSFITKLNPPFNIHLPNSFHNIKDIHTTTFNKSTLSIYPYISTIFYSTLPNTRIQFTSRTSIPHTLKYYTIKINNVPSHPH